MRLIYVKKEYQLISVDNFLQKKVEYNCPPIKCGLCLLSPKEDSMEWKARK